MLNSSSIISFLNMAVGAIPFKLPFHLTNLPSKKRGSSGPLFHLKDRKPGGKPSSCQFCLYKIVKVLHSFACPIRMAPSKFHVHLHSRVWATNTLSKSITRNQLTLIILFLFNKYELFSMSIQTLTPWSLHRFGTTCSPLSLEDPNAWKLHIACSNSGLQAHRLCTKSSFSSFDSVLAIWLCHNIIILSASNFSASVQKIGMLRILPGVLYYTHQCCKVTEDEWFWIFTNILDWKSQSNICRAQTYTDRCIISKYHVKVQPAAI